MPRMSALLGISLIGNTSYERITQAMERIDKYVGKLRKA